MGARLVKRKLEESVVILGQELVGLDLKKASTDTIADATRKLSRATRKRLLSKLNSSLRGVSRKDKEERVAAAKLYVSLLPDSFQSIKRLLRTKKDRWSYEVHFTLFCFLDDSLSLPLRPIVLKRILTMVGEYLKVARSDTGQAAWMAADLLGHHWPGRKSLEVLTSISRNGQYATGRYSALSGLKRRLQSQDRNERAQIIRSLEATAASDPSPDLRRKAVRILKSYSVTKP
jgi:hypothetical protein